MPSPLKITPLNPRPNHVIFDMDGTLCDTTGLIVETWERAFAVSNLRSPGTDALRHHVGVSLIQSVDDHLPNESPQSKAAFLDTYRQLYIDTVSKQHPPMFPHAIKVLDTLRDAGIKLTVATGKSRAGLTRTLSVHNLAPYFQATRTADDAPSKPHPQMITDLLDLTWTEAHETIMIGDTSHDLQMAHAANVRPFAVTFGAQPKSLLAKHKPTGFLTCLSDLLPLLNLH